MAGAPEIPDPAAALRPPSDSLGPAGLLERQSLQALRSLACLGDDEFCRHLGNTARLSLVLATAAGLDRADREKVWYAASLHDIGKIGVDRSILSKSGLLESSEVEEVRTHTILGHGILSAVEGELFQSAARVALSHHERWDGRGYPHGLSGEGIPFEARLVAIADVYDCVTSGRPYSPARTPAEAADELERHAGTQFDPELVALFLEKALADAPAD